LQNNPIAAPIAARYPIKPSIWLKRTIEPLTKLRTIPRTIQLKTLIPAQRSFARIVLSVTIAQFVLRSIHAASISDFQIKFLAANTQFRR
jgi:hypothetical protein